MTRFPPIFTPIPKGERGQYQGPHAAWGFALGLTASHSDELDYRAMLARVRFYKRNLDSIPEDWPEGRGAAAYLANWEMESGWTLRYRDAVIDQAIFSGCLYNKFKRAAP